MGRLNTNLSGVRTIIFLGILWLSIPLASADDPSAPRSSTNTGITSVNFVTDIAPIFTDHCVRCHSPGINKGELSLATSANLMELDFVLPGDANSSRLVEVISRHEDQPAEMPAEGEPLSDEDVNRIRQWIDQGAVWPDTFVIREKPKADSSWWSLQPLPNRFAHADIDGFVNEKLSQHGLAMNPPADRRTLIRRATYDLIGLPPTPEDVEQFVNDTDPCAYEKLIDRLLSSAAYGEHWGRHWLDVVRFGESNGFERNVIINELWPFRDFVIDSLNADKPMNQFIREHLAGDVLADEELQAKIGSAFLVAGPYDNVNNQDAKAAAQIRANTLDEMIRATSAGFLGLTIGCARCHDHKFDPITQEDYYAMYATFAGVRHGAVEIATEESLARRRQQLKPLQQEKSQLQQALADLNEQVLQRAKANLSEIEAEWKRPSLDRTGTVDQFAPVQAKFVRLVCKAQDRNPLVNNGFRIDEFEVWTAGKTDRSINVAAASRGAKATGDARKIEDFPGAYGAPMAIDGQFGTRFISVGATLTIELAQLERIDRVVFSSARHQANPDQAKFTFVAEYDIEVSQDGKLWTRVASGDDRQPVNRGNIRDHRLRERTITEQERSQRNELNRKLSSVQANIRDVPSGSRVWIGSRSDKDAKGPFHVFVGGSPQRLGDPVVPASLQVLAGLKSAYQMPGEVSEADRRLRLADWIVDDTNPLTARVIANRLWHYHFGTGIVSTPNDFGYMGQRPSHPELLDFLADQLQRHDWRLKDMHRMMMRSQAYRQSSRFSQTAAALDADARLLWRFPPRRLTAEEVRDSVLLIAGQLDRRPGGPGFRLYQYMQDNVSTYKPLDAHGPDTYRRAVYHQNARASVVDLMTEFDQPDCTLSAPRRSTTTTPLQALTMLNHSFTIDMAHALANRINNALLTSDRSPEARVGLAYQFCYARSPSPDEMKLCTELMNSEGLTALCRTLLNTSELIYVQ